MIHQTLIKMLCVFTFCVWNSHNGFDLFSLFVQPKYSTIDPCTLLDHCLKKYTTLLNIWTYQLLCKKLHNLFKIAHKLCKTVHKLCNFLTQQLVGSFVSQCCVIFLNSGLTVYRIHHMISLRVCQEQTKGSYFLTFSQKKVVKYLLLYLDLAYNSYSKE